LLEKSSETKLKLYQQINAAFIQMALNDYQPLTTKAILPNDFVTAMNEDLDLPNAITAIWKYTKGLNKLIRNKDYATLSANVNNLIKTLEILGLTY
jgi:cysteinyl-tRNA synthetase